MKKLLLIIGIASLAYSCQKKAEQPQPAKVETVEQKPQVQQAIDTTIGMVKVTVWSNRKNYITDVGIFTKKTPYASVGRKTV